MKNPSDDILEPLQIALQLEREGRKFFVDAASATNNKLARQTFEFLADEETRHIEKIEAFYRAAKKSGGEDCPVTEDSDAEQKLAGFNIRLAELRDTVGNERGDIEAYRTALKFENGAEKFYQDQLDRSGNMEVKQFYRWLIAEETMHARLLRSCLKFVEDPAAWFEKHRS